MSKTKLTPKEELELVNDYAKNEMGIYDVCEKYHVGKLKVKDILAKYEVPLRKKGKQPLNEVFKVSDWKTKKYNEIEGFYYIVYDENTDFESSDIDNLSGALTSYIEKQYNVETPSLYDRRKYYMKTGNYWWEQWLKVKSVEKPKVKKCPYCNWETIDIENKSGVFEQHLNEAHNITVEDYIKDYPQDEEYFKNYQLKKEREEMLQDERNHVICPLCNQKFVRISNYHIEHKHGMNWYDFKKKFPNVKLMSDTDHELSSEQIKKGNMLHGKAKYISKPEREIREFLDSFGVKYESNRQILIGKEIDIYIPDKKIGIEFDGLKFHTEFFGKKDQYYHLNKTLKCNEVGVSLIHIFEDEYMNTKDIVYSKLRHILDLCDELPRIYARKCEIREIYKHEAKDFLDKNHIQGYSASTVYFGAFYCNKLVGVMTFKKGNIKNYGWELTRFATDNNYVCCGLGGKMFNFFVKNYNPYSVISFADRRWTLDINHNMYTKLGFMIKSVNKPEFRYYNGKLDRYKRIHKLNLSKRNLIKRYDLDPKLTELEMTKMLGYDRIWDCGLVKYIYYNQNYKIDINVME